MEPKSKERNIHKMEYLIKINLKEKGNMSSHRKVSLKRCNSEAHAKSGKGRQPTRTKRTINNTDKGHLKRTIRKHVNMETRTNLKHTCHMRKWEIWKMTSLNTPGVGKSEKGKYERGPI